MRALVATALLAACSFEVPAPNLEGGGAAASGGTSTGAGDPVGAAGSGGEPSGGGGEAGQGGTGGAIGGGGSGAGGSGATGGGGSAGCVAPQAACFGLEGCFDVETDEAHCGADCDTCLPGGECFAGVCGCPLETDQCINPPGCYDLLADDAHCGDCITNCTASQDCSKGLCCPIGFERCGMPLDGCYDIANDDAHCGDCMTSCPSDRSCVAGSCLCDAGTLECNGSCIDPSANALHCGQCDHSCGSLGFPNAACTAGMCQPAVATGALGLGTTKSLGADPSTNLLYSLEISGGASNGLLHRFDASQASGTAASELNPVLSVSNISVAAGNLAFSARFGDGPLRVGPFGSFTSTVSSNGFSLLEQHAGTIYYGSNLCLKKTPTAPVDVACFSSAYPVTMLPLPMDPTRALVHPISTSGTQGHVRLVNLDGNTIETVYTAFPIAQLADDAGHTIAVDATGTSIFYLGIDGGGLSLYRFDVVAGVLVELFEIGASAGPVSLFRDEGTLFFVARGGGQAQIYRASIATLIALTQPDPGSASLLASYAMQSAFAGDFEQDAQAIYFVESGAVYRLRKPAP